VEEIRLQLPRRGIANASGLSEQGPDFTAPQSMLNVVLYDADEDRPRGGTREGSVALPATLGSGEVQGLATVNRPSISNGLKIGTASDAGTGTSSVAGALTGNVFAIDSVQGGEWSHHFSVAPDGPASVTVTHAAFSRDGSRVFVGTNYNRVSDSKAKFRIRSLNPATGATNWTYDHTLVGGVPESIAQLVPSNEYLFVVLANSFVLVLNPATGALVDRWNNTWAQENVAAVVITENVGQFNVPTERLLVAFKGTTSAGLITGGTLADGSVLTTTIESTPTNQTASHYRAGVMKLSILPVPTGPGLPTTPVLSQVSWPATGLPSSDPRYEGNHGYFRFSERSATSPFGCLPTAMVAAPDGTVWVSRTNRGWGPNSTWRPGYEAETDPRRQRSPVTLCQISAAGTMLRELDPANYQGVFNGSGYSVGFNHWNDIYEPILRSVTASAAGVVACAGQQNHIGASAWVLSSTGSAIGFTNLVSSSTRIYAGVSDPSDGNPVFVGQRNTSWTGASGANAHVWKLNAATGAIAWAFDLGSAVTVHSVAAFGGRVILGSAKF